MTHVKSLLIAAPVALGLLGAPAAQAQWHDHRGWGHERFEHRGRGGLPLAGALLGLGAAAVIGGIIASQPRYYAPPPVTYAPPPGYYPAPYYARPYYGQPEYDSPYAPAN